MVTDVAREAKEKQRRERARQQLLKLNRKKREDKIASLLKELSQHSELLGQRELADPEEFQLMLEEAGHDSEEVGIHHLEPAPRLSMLVPAPGCCSVRAVCVCVCV